MKAENYVDIKTGKPRYCPVGYVMTEKFDGARVQWLPSAERLISRYGNDITAPLWFIDYFKGIQHPLDGELFFGYGNWGMTGICRAKSSNNEELWRKARYLVFDLPDPDAGTYQERIGILEKCQGVGVWGSSTTPIWLVPRQLVSNTNMLDTFYQEVLQRGGEGIMLNNPCAFYRDGRTDAILKYKPVLDSECIIVGYKQGNGKYTGKLGSFIVHPIEDGCPDPTRQFSMSGMTDLIRSSYMTTHPIGTVLRYCCTEFTRTGKPRHPRYIGICRKPVTREQEISILEQSKATPVKTKPIPRPRPRTEVAPRYTSPAPGYTSPAPRYTSPPPPPSPPPPTPPEITKIKPVPRPRPQVVPCQPPQPILPRPIPRPRPQPRPEIPDTPLPVPVPRPTETLTKPIPKPRPAASIPITKIRARLRKT